jgi:hypothetical protein
MINTIIDNLIDSKNTEEQENKKKHEKVVKSNTDNSNVSLYQGINFKLYQEKIKNAVEKKEGFTTNISNTNTSNSIIQNLKNEYNKTLNDYNNAVSKYNEHAKTSETIYSDYVQRVSSKNQFLNKVIRFNTGQLYYVTKQGVAKYIPNKAILQSISGKNGCPITSGNYIDITIPWIHDYSIEGRQIPTNPSLIVGKNMKMNESCGFEGSNVFVNRMLPSVPTPNYVGCYQDNETKPTMTFIGGSPSSASKTSGTYNFNQCENAAIMGGYQYFALQNSDFSTGMGYCGVSNHAKTVKKFGPGIAFVPLWSSNTAGKPVTYAVLTKNGTLNVNDSKNNTYYRSPNGTNCNQVYSTSWNIDAPGNDITYLSHVKRENCEQYCNDNPNCGGFAWNRTTDNSCWIKSGKLSNTSNNNNRILIKKTVDTSECKYFLTLQNDGNMCIYKGTPNTANTTNIWSSNTSGRQQETNKNYPVAKSKYRMSFIKNDQPLNKGDWVASEDGKLLLIMQKDGNLVLYTFKTNCTMGTGNNSKNYYGGTLANALYDIGTIGIKSNMGQLSFIDPDSQIHSYPTSNISYSNTYSNVIQNTDIPGNDIRGAALNNVPDVTKCMAACNKLSDCNAFVYDTTGPYPVCFPKKVSGNGLYSPNTFKPSLGKTIYIRDKKPKNPPKGLYNSVNYVDSITYQNYGKQGGPIQKAYGLASIVPVQKQHLSQLQDKMNLLLSQLNKNVNDLKKYNINLSTDTKRTISEGFDLSTSNEKDILKTKNDKKIKKDYNYLIFTILALGIAIFFAIKHKNM